jgi:glycosyltransferase involved in cell wall biosynthesis
MRIVILTQYYPPETGAPQNRLSDLALRLHEAGDTVEVWTAMPNYPAGMVHKAYRWRFFSSELRDDIPVYRSWIFATTSKAVVARLLNYFSFVFSVMLRGLFRARRVDVILCESPPLFLGISALFLCKLKRARLVFNVSDLWPESAEKLGIITNKRLLSVATRLEELLYRRSMLVSGQTKGILQSVSSRFPNLQTWWLPNGADPTRFNPQLDRSWRKRLGFADQDFLVLYAGIIGHAQGLEILIDAADKLRESHVHFVVMGSGPVKADLIRLCREKQLVNIHFPEPVGTDAIPSILAAVDATVVPLRKLDLFRGAIPSKIFEALAMRKPILLGVDGEARTLFVEEGRCALYFEPEDPEQLAAAALELASNPQLCHELGLRGEAYVKQHFDRRKIAADFRNTLIQGIQA